MKRVLIVLIAISLTSASGGGIEKYDASARFKAMFLYGFANYIDWPSKYKQGDFVVGILGNSPVYTELSKMALTRKAVNQKISVIKYNGVNDIENCHILFVSESQSSIISNCIDKTKSNSTLVVGETAGLTQKGAGINFVIRDNRVKFIINKKNIEDKKMNISSSLLPRALSVE